MKKPFIILAFVIVGTAIAALGFVVFVSQKHASDNGLSRVSVAGHDLLVTIADDPAKRAQGLSGRPLLNENEGMLFVFEQPAVYSIHMKDMRFAIDVMWIDQDKKVLGVTRDLRPDTYPTLFPAPTQVMYALEVNAGWGDRQGIQIGDVVRIPMLE